MDFDSLRTVTTIALMVAFIGVCAWAWSKRRRKRFDDAANLPFADEDIAARSEKHTGGRQA